MGFALLGLYEMLLTYSSFNSIVDALVYLEILVMLRHSIGFFQSNYWSANHIQMGKFRLQIKHKKYKLEE